MSREFHNGLTPAELERLALIAEEASEVIQVVGKIIRHGFESFHPDNPSVTNRKLLVSELGDLDSAMRLCIMSGDFTNTDIVIASMAKSERMRKWLHHQGEF